jgi:hypothetical protein
MERKAKREMMYAKKGWFYPHIHTEVGLFDEVT